MDILEDPIVYGDMEGWRNVDPRLYGVDCVPLFGRASIKTHTSGAAMHVHPRCIEFCLCVKGRLRYETTEGEFQVLPGHLFVSQPDSPHRRCNNPKGMFLYQILFQIPKRGNTVLDLPMAESLALVNALRRFPYRMCPSTTRVNMAFERLYALCGQKARGNVLHRLKVKSAALELFVAMTEAPSIAPSAKGRPNSKLKAVIAQMEAHPEKDYPVERIAAEAGMSPVLFTDEFKRTTGLTPHAFLLDVRVARTREELSNSTRSIAAIAECYRFPSARHFATMFRRIVGMSPSEYRKKFM